MGRVEDSCEISVTPRQNMYVQILYYLILVQCFLIITMSDISPLELILQWKLSIETPSLAYAGKAATKTVLFTLEISYPLFKAWYSFLKKKCGQNTKPSCASQEPSTSTVFQDEAETHYSCTDLLELSVPGNCFCIREDQ